MSDRELWEALSVIARRAGWIERGQRIEVVGDPREEPAGPWNDALCLAPGEYKGSRLLCTYARGHHGIRGEIVHSWQNARIGKSPCENNQGPSANAPLCERPTNHAGEHKATGADGVRWTWGDAPRESAAMGCMAWEWGTNGHKAGCMLVAGHEGPHKGLDADGTSVFTWPCPCYPDCTGHTVGELCGAKNAAENPVMAGQVCALLRGHEGGHEATVNGQRWLFARTDPTIERA